jgi:hypothetical protein
MAEAPPANGEDPMSIEADRPLNHTPPMSPNGDGGAVLVTVDEYDDAVAVVVVPAPDRARALVVLGGTVG